MQQSSHSIILIRRTNRRRLQSRRFYFWWPQRYPIGHTTHSPIICAMNQSRHRSEPFRHLWTARNRRWEVCTWEKHDADRDDVTRCVLMTSSDIEAIGRGEGLCEQTEINWPQMNTDAADFRWKRATGGQSDEWATWGWWKGYWLLRDIQVCG